MEKNLINKDQTKNGGQDKPSNANETCVGPGSEMAGKASSCAGCPNQKSCSSGESNQPNPAVGQVANRLGQVKHKILVLSGKGGVGKSTFACQLAFSLAARGHQVGLLDVDICGPSVPQMLGLAGQEVHQSASGWSPVYVGDNLGVMSIGFMLPRPDDAVIWRGPRKNGLIRQFLTDVDWGQLDYLVVDTPPGTSDEHISIIQYLKGAGVDGAVVVTTPQEVAMADVRKEISFCHKTELNVIGVVENMSGLRVPVSVLKFKDSSGRDRTQQALETLKNKAPEILEMMADYEVFPSFQDGPEGMANRFQVPFLGRIPLDPNLLRSCERGESFAENYPTSAAFVPFENIVDGITAAVDSS
mmetsp:Transcript_37714/g.48604  ORF Transcript_37714/g.48604 Transcript_37714/m.48604 type:complete len:358 (+) Transcript_37714:113-1186(+)